MATLASHLVLGIRSKSGSPDRRCNIWKNVWVSNCNRDFYILEFTSFTFFAVVQKPRWNMVKELRPLNSVPDSLFDRPKWRTRPDLRHRRWICGFRGYFRLRPTIHQPLDDMSIEINHRFFEGKLKYSEIIVVAAYVLG